MGGNMRLRNKKTGEIKSIEEIIRDAFLSNELDSLKSIDTNWEDVDVTNATNIPLIKDEKNRKVVRAWLEANDLDGATFHTSSHFFHYWNLRGFNDNGQGVDIDFFLTGEGIPNLIDGKYYTKFELCGEEE